MAAILDFVGSKIECDDHVVEDMAIIHYIFIVLDVIEAVKLSYPVGWRTCEYNLFVDSYCIVTDRMHISIVWKNKQSEEHTLSFRRFRFKSTLLNKLYFKFIPRLTTTDYNRRHNVLGVIYADFCKETGAIKGDFSAVKTFADSVEFTLSLVYVRFFSKLMSLADFLSIYDPGNNKIFHKSVLAMSAYVNYLLANQ